MNNYCESYAGKTVLVTGGAGAIGSNLCRELVRLGARVLVLDDLSSGQRWNVPSCQGVLFTEGDILDEVKLKRVFFEGPQIVYHLAAFFANQNSLDHPERDLMVNGMGTLRLLEYSLLTGVERFVFASSGCAVYDGEAPLPLNEDYMSMNLTTPYQVTKMLGELYCNFFYNHYGLKVVKTRFFNNYGAGEVPGQYRNVVPNFIYYAMKGLPLPITGGGEETRDFTYVGDTIDGLLRVGVMEAAIGKEFNLATCRETRSGTWLGRLTNWSAIGPVCSLPAGANGTTTAAVWRRSIAPKNCSATTRRRRSKSACVIRSTGSLRTGTRSRPPLVLLPVCPLLFVRWSSTRTSRRWRSAKRVGAD